jgi:hypothetical protein
LGWFVAVTSRHAYAQTDAAAARQLFDEARTLVLEQKYAEACPRFEQSYKRDPGIGTLFNLADCLQHLGRTASAWAKFRDVADEAARTNQPDRERIARNRVDELASKLPKLVVYIESKDEGLELRRDGVAMLFSDQGKPIILDPGEHQLEARAPGKKTWETTVEVPPQGKTVEVTVPPLEALAPPSMGVPLEAPPSNSVSPQVTLVNAQMEPRRDTTTPSSSQKYLAYTAGGIGIVGVTLGSIFGLRVLSKNDQADSICPSSEHCSTDDQTRFDKTINDAKRERTYAFVGFGVGGAALVTGAVLLLTAPKPDSAAWHVSPAVQSGHLGATLEGTF